MSIKPPKPIVISENSIEDWRIWKQSFEFYAKATDLYTKDGEVQVATFMSVLGYEAINIYNSFVLSDDDKKDLKAIITHFDEYFLPQRNIIYERFIFNSANQKETESIEEYVTKLKNLANSCEFGILKEDLIRDRFVIGLNSDSIREKLLLEPKLMLKDAIEVAKSHEQTKKQIESLKENQPMISGLTKHKSAKPINNDSVYNQDFQRNNYTFQCRNCGNLHGPRQCPAFKQVCKKCFKQNHFAKYCRSSVNDSKPQVKSVEQSSEGECEFLTVLQISKNEASDRWTVSLKTGNVDFKATIDTGAACNVLPKNIAQRVGVQMKTTSVKRLVSYSKHHIEVLGEVELNCLVDHKHNATISFLVADSNNVSPVLGANTCEYIGLVKRTSYYKSVNELGTIKDFVYDIDLVDNPTRVRPSV